jgi:FkbM family methyltransferase
MEKNVITKAGMRFIKINRTIFAETPVQKWRLTAYLYKKIYYFSAGNKEKKVTYKGIELYLPGEDTAIVPSIVGGYFESLELDIFARIAAKSKTLLDVGGNIGIYTVLGLVKNPSLEVHAFEPVKQNADYFDRNLKLNKQKQSSTVKLNLMAVGNKEGYLELFISEGNSAIHSASSKHSGGNVSEKVKMITIDQYCRDNNLKPDLLKIDVEGYDGFVLEGAAVTMSKYKPTLFIEYDPEALENCGYKPKQMLETLFDIYNNAYVFDEKRGVIKSANKQDTLRAPVYSNMNLLFCEKNAHIKHITDYLA